MKFDLHWARGHTKKTKLSKVDAPTIQKTIFRTNNPKKLNHELLDRMLIEEFNILPKAKQAHLFGEEENSQSNLTKVDLK